MIMDQSVVVKMIVRVFLNESPGITKLSERYKLVFNCEGIPQIGLHFAVDMNESASVEIKELHFNPFEKILQYTAYSSWETLTEEEFYDVCKMFDCFWSKKK